MLPLYDMIANAQNGQAMDLLARQFNLSQQQTQLALEALLPAFSQGLKRNAADPYGVGAFLSALSSGRHAPYFDDAVGIGGVALQALISTTPPTPSPRRASRKETAFSAICSAPRSCRAPLPPKPPRRPVSARTFSGRCCPSSPPW